MRVAAALVCMLLAVAGCSTRQPARNGPQETRHPTVTATASSSRQGQPGPHVVRTVAGDLAAPWGITFLPDGTALVGERDTTRVLAITDGRARVVGRVEEAVPGGEGGLLDLAASPSYRTDHRVYCYLTAAEDNRVVVMSFDGHHLGEPRPVLTGIPKGAIHDGGRLRFGPAGDLFVSTGNTGDGELSQDAGSLGGKILRITPDGQPAPGNPDPDSPVWTTGHRNVEGLAFDDRGRLWATEFGENTWDELNLIRRGRNYGWPLVEGRTDDPGPDGLRHYQNPDVQWHTNEASPSGLAFWQGSLWAGALRGQRLWQIPVTAGGVGRPRAWFVGDYGRLRTVVAAPDGHLWVTTSNRDGRGDPRRHDDKILEIALR